MRLGRIYGPCGRFFAYKRRGGIPRGVGAPQPVELTGLSLDGLVRALERILARQTQEEEPGRVFRSITRDRFTIEQCVFNLASRLKKGPVLFTDMLSDEVTRDEIVSYFMAMLELLKLGRLHAQQEHVFDDILILPGRRDEDGDGEPADESAADGEPTDR